MYLGESSKAILKEHETDPTYYNEAMSYVDAHLWQGAMEAKLDYVSKKFWDLIETPEWIQNIGVSGSTRGKEG